MQILDSRRLTGPHLLLDGPGAILDVALHGLDPEVAASAWRAALAPLLDAVGWKGATLGVRTSADVLQLAFAAPIDALYAATEVNESAWHVAARGLGGGEAPRDHRDDPHDPDLEDSGLDGDSPEDVDAVVARLRATIAAERNPALERVADEAQRRGVTLLSDDRRVSVGLGTGSRAWPVEEMAATVKHLPWETLHDVPVAMVTGTNGKTTTVRLLGAIASAAGHTAGVTSTDGVTIADETVATGDYSGPNGARTVLRDRRVTMGLLEVARGGILRRGLPIARATAACVTNVARDHLGEYAIHDVDELADAKLVVAKAVGAGGRVVLNADDPLLLARGVGLAVPVVWFTLDPAHPAVARHRASGGEACILDGNTLVWARGAERRMIAKVEDIPITHGGAARHNIANALAAIGVAASLGLPVEAITRGLASFDSSIARNPGRANIWRLGGVTAIVDYAHNPHGLAALVAMARAFDTRRRAIVFGQAGDRDDASIRELARVAWSLGPTRTFVKEMESFLRGRHEGEVPAVIEAELARLGAPAGSVSRHPNELDAVRAALAWAKDGDLLVLTTHAQRDVVIGLLERLAATGWRAGKSLESTVPVD